jgi:hypothetical protein
MTKERVTIDGTWVADRNVYGGRPPKRTKTVSVQHPLSINRPFAVPDSNHFS